MQASNYARPVINMKPRDSPAATKSVSFTVKSVSTHGLTTRLSRPRRTVAGTFLLPSSPSLLLLLAAIIFAAFASSSSSFVRAAASTMASDVQEVVEETASAWSGGFSRSAQDDKLLEEDELTTSSWSSCVDHTVLKLRKEIGALEAEKSVLRGERDAALETHFETAPDLRAHLDKWEKNLMLPSFEERQLVSAGSDVVISSSDGVTRVGERRLVGNCPTFLLANDPALVASDGWNLLSVSCNLGATISVSGAGKLMKIKKDPSAVGVVVVDRQASEDQGRHFSVYNGAALEVEGLTLTGGYENVRFLFFYSPFFPLVFPCDKKYVEGLYMLVLLLLLMFLSYYFSLGYRGYADVISLPLSIPLFPLLFLSSFLFTGWRGGRSSKQ